MRTKPKSIFEFIDFSIIITMQLQRDPSPLFDFLENNLELMQAMRSENIQSGERHADVGGSGNGSCSEESIKEILQDKSNSDFLLLEAIVSVVDSTIASFLANKNEEKQENKNKMHRDHDHDHDPLPYIASLDALSFLLTQFKQGDIALNLDAATLGHYLAAKFFSATTHPVQHAACLNNLGNAYCARINGSRRKNFENAIRCYDSALRIRTKALFPKQFATTQNNLALAYRERLAGSREENLKMGLAACELSLGVFSAEATPVEWASTQLIMASIYLCRSRRDSSVAQQEQHPVDSAERGLACSDRALRVFGIKTHPAEWCKASELRGSLLTQVGSP